MPRTLRSQLLLYGVVLTWLAGGTIAGFGYWRIGRAIREEADAHVRDMVRSASRLLEDERRWVDRRGVAEQWSGIEERVCRAGEVTDPDLMVLSERAAEQGRAVGIVHRKDTGLWLVCVAREEGDLLEITQCPIRGAHHLPDQLRDQIFAPGEMDGEPATVTIFDGPRRIATNVRKKDGTRAIDTLVSRPVEERVLHRGQPFNDRAWVVNRWVITCYLPIRSPTGKILGMLYAGIDEEPYLARGRTALWTFLAVILAITALISIGAIWFARRLARPLTELTAASRALAEGQHESLRNPPESPEEIRILAESFDTMADQVVRRTEALELSREEAQAALESYLEVLAFVAHEIKSPVAGALTALEVVEMGFVGEVPDKMRPSFERLRRYLRRGLDMAVNFTYLSRAESRGFDVTKRTVDSIRIEIVAPAVADFADEAERRRMPISVEGDASLEVDPQLLRIAMDNLIGNAVKYGEEGTEIEVGIRTSEGHACVTVKNRGVGIPAERHGEVFQKFSRVNDRQLRGRRGSGVGLYLTHLIAELHGGEVAVTGEYGEWVEFAIELPA